MLFGGIVLLGHRALSFVMRCFLISLYWVTIPCGWPLRTAICFSGQSLSFFHNEFAGRVATKVMQTALAVRESVLARTNGSMWSRYFFSVIALVFTTDWRLSIPLLVWLVLWRVSQH